MTDILTAIDNALRDYHVSPDAMRWTPDAEEIEAQERAREEAAAEELAMTRIWPQRIEIIPMPPSVSRHSHFELPADSRWRQRKMTRICAWLRANGVDPCDVPIESTVMYRYGLLHYDVYVRASNGKITLVHGEIPTRHCVTPLRYRWNEPLPLPIDGHAYRARRRNRRK